MRVSGGLLALGSESVLQLSDPHPSFEQLLIQLRDHRT
jgi:hypothetical protein